ncbi:hypothetical protein ACIQUS_03185 [Pseudomonas sp. NPDC090755]|uniref:hypothetical protein n=1 Tax=Pseudomonas sp. NPDC090755 TaxID=3364481 RepID=UPI00383AE6E5
MALNLRTDETPRGLTGIDNTGTFSGVFTRIPIDQACDGHSQGGLEGLAIALKQPV